MKLNKDLQAALLLTLYICRAGRATIHGMAEGLHLSEPFLHNVALKLRRAKIIRSVRGPGGGYELVGEPTVRQVFEAIQPVRLNNSDTSPQSRTHEGRTLTHLSESLSLSLRPVLSQKIRNLGMDLTAKESKKFDSRSPSVEVH